MEDLDDNMDYETNDRDIGSDFDGDEYEYMVCFKSLGIYTHNVKIMFKYNILFSTDLMFVAGIEAKSDVYRRR
ncbi:hypothetical protein Hanom_Chr00s158332g01824411 [Helianthus anomalus]